MKKIAIFQSDLKVGGIQKSLVNFLTLLPEDEFDIDVFLYEKNVFYDLSSIKENVHFHFLKPYPYWNRFIYFNILRQFHKKKINNKKYDLAIDFSSYRNECAIGAINTDAPKKVMWIHNDVSIKKQEEPKYKILVHFFKGKYRYFDKFAAVSKGITEPFTEETGIPSEKISVIPNFINTEEIHQKAKEKIDFKTDKNVYNLVSMGRLCHQKGFDILLEEFAKVVEKRPQIHLYILGDGPDKEKLLAQREQLNLNSYVTFLGNRTNPFPYLAQMDGFVLDSRYEGQGMVLWEAKAVGLNLFMPKRLEKYNDGLTGCDDLVSALINAKPGRCDFDPLEKYNQSVLDGIRSLFD